MPIIVAIVEGWDIMLELARMSLIVVDVATLAIICKDAQTYEGTVCARHPIMMPVIVVMSIAHRFLDLYPNLGCMCGLFFIVQSWYCDDTKPLHHAIMVVILTMPGACNVPRRHSLYNGV